MKIRTGRNVNSTDEVELLAENEQKSAFRENFIKNPISKHRIEEVVVKINKVWIVK